MTHTANNNTRAHKITATCWVISCDINMANIPGDPMGTMYGDVSPVYEDQTAARAALEELRTSGEWPDGRPNYRLTETTMPADAARALVRQCEYDVEEVLAGWARGEYGGGCSREFS